MRDLQNETARVCQVSHLLALLSRSGSLAVLELVEKGMTIGPRTHVRSLSKRQTRTRLSELATVGLIKRKGNTCFLTPLGRVVLDKYIPRLEVAFISGKKK